MCAKKVKRGPACSLRICTLQGRVRILHKGPGFRVAGTCLRALARPLAREGRARGFSKRGNRGQPVGENDRKGGLCGYDAGKKIKGRKRFAVVDTLGLPIVVQIQAASVQERDGAPLRSPKPGGGPQGSSTSGETAGSRDDASRRCSARRALP
jgi:hypothetical protein